MAYDGANLNLVSRAPIAGGPQVWTYRSTDPSTDVDASGYITDGGSRGMLVGDMVIVQDTDGSYLTTNHVVATVSTTYPGAVDLTDAVAISSVTSSD